MVRTCIVEGCFSGTEIGLVFFCIPSNPERRKLWHAFVGEEKKLTKYSRVCSIHFPPEAFLTPFSLKRTAVPCLPPHTPFYLKNSSGTSLSTQASVPSCAPANEPALLENTEENQCTEESRDSSPAECAVNDETSPVLEDCVETFKEEALEDVKELLCRICGSRTKDLSSIFCEGKTGEDNISLEKKIKMYLPIELSADDSLPLKICSKCCDLVESWHQLYMSCLAADSVLRATFGFNKDQVAFERPEDQMEKTSSQEENGEQPSGVGEQRLVDPAAESKEVGDSCLGENSAVIIGNTTNQIVTDYVIKSLPLDEDPFPYTCQHCSGRFKSVYEGFQHRKQCAIEPTICDICGKKVHQRRNLKAHRKQHFFVPVLCEKCGCQLHSPTSVSYHKKMCHEGGRESKHFCEPCCMVFSVERNFRLHLEQHKKMKKNSKSRTFSVESCSVSDEKECFMCPVCDACFQDKLTLVQHMNTDSKTSCLQCGRYLQNERTVFLHKCRKWTCPYCCAEFSGMKALRQHQLNHKPGEPFTCRKCGCRFISRLLFRRHMTGHYVRGCFQCEKCGKQFSRKYPYQDHLRKHEGTKLKCKLCGWNYFSRNSIYKHLRKFHPGATKKMTM